MTNNLRCGFRLSFEIHTVMDVLSGPSGPPAGGASESSFLRGSGTSSNYAPVTMTAEVDRGAEVIGICVKMSFYASTLRRFVGIQELLSCLFAPSESSALQVNLLNCVFLPRCSSVFSLLSGSISFLLPDAWLTKVA